MCFYLFFWSNSLILFCKKYLKRHLNGNALQDDLWTVLNEEAQNSGRLDPGLTMKLIMDTWTLQKGYPVVHVQRDYTQGIFKVSQKWFLLNPLNKVPQNAFDINKWYVPFTYTTSEEKDFDFEQRPVWMRPEDYESIFTINI